MKKLLLFAFAACALAACSDDDGDSRVPATAVVLDCTEKELAVGETLQLTATPAPANTTDDVVWSSDAEEFATVSESGLVTAVAAGTAKISATLPLAAVLRREITIMSFGRRAAATTIWP